MMRAQCYIVAYLYMLVLCKAKRVALDNLLCEGLGHSGLNGERDEGGGGGRILHLRGENVCMPSRCRSMVCVRFEKGKCAS